jgi:ankyrin repeat protein
MLRTMLFEAAEAGDVKALAAAPDLSARKPPYGWTLLHGAAHAGQLGAVSLLLERGLDVNAREDGDNSYAMHWAAAEGHLEVVRVLADAGGDVVGAGDDHALEVIGWATCFGECHAPVAEFLVSRGARHNVWSAIAMGLEPGART